MDKLDRLLKAAKPSVPDLPSDFSQNVLTRIEQEGLEIHFRPTVVTHSRLFLILGSLALAIALALFNYNSYALKMNGSLELLYFGFKFLGDFIGYLPLDLIIPSLALSALSAWMIWKSGFLRIGVIWLTMVSFLFTGVGGTVIAAVGINERIEAGIKGREKNLPWLSFFHNNRAAKFIHHPNFRMGRIEKIINDNLIVMTPHGDRINIKIPPLTRIKVGQVLRLSGQDSKAVFNAQDVHICNPSRVNRYFNHSDHHKKMMKSCCTGNRMEQ